MLCLLLRSSRIEAKAVATAAQAGPNPKAVAEVASGKRSEAHASWWGFDPEDATAALQSAINSGARKVIVDDMGAPWVTDKLTLAGNQEIVFKKFADYWDKGSFAIDRVEFVPITDSSSRLASLRSGDLQMIDDLLQTHDIGKGVKQDLVLRCAG